MRSILPGILILLAGVLPAQGDTLGVLTRRAVLQLVLDNHPAARQADLRTDMGEALVRSARGGFDPRATVDYDRKDFDDKDYFDLLEAGLEVPTWFGVELYGAYQQTGGQFLDPQNTTPENGLLKAGVSVPIGQGLFIDKRRAELRKSFAYQDMAEAERLELLNQVFYEALADHVEWVAAYKQVIVAREAVDLATMRFQAVRGSFIGGDVPAIDTLEAWLQVQDRQMRRQEAELGFRNASLSLSNHLWDEYLRPLEIARGVVPDTLDLVPPADAPVLDTLLARAMERHPKLLGVAAKVEQLDVDRQLRGEMLKPKLDLKYSLLGNAGAVTGDGADGDVFRGGDQQVGVGFEMPLLLRRERGELSLARLRLSDAELGLERERLRIRNTIGQRDNELATLNGQVELGQSMVSNYRRLLAGENSRFALGESSLFLLNRREVSLLDSRIKLVDLEAKRRKAGYTLDKDAGVLWENVLSELGINP
ncbi:MAG TPA: TolC family protein [Flavobacteriales bacterium]|nr:TolC family protein [Flavobacteriales bacterium]